MQTGACTSLDLFGCHGWHGLVGTVDARRLAQFGWQKPETKHPHNRLTPSQTHRPQFSDPVLQRLNIEALELSSPLRPRAKRVLSQCYSSTNNTFNGPSALRPSHQARVSWAVYAWYYCQQQYMYPHRASR
jgi:hypothetical protein